MTAKLPVAFLPLIDAAPLIVAVELGFDRDEGIALDLRRAHSWSSLRDMVSFGQVTAAQMLAPMPVATALGLVGTGAALASVAVLSTNGEVIGVSNAMAQRIRDTGYSFATGFGDARAAGQALIAAADGPLRIGVPFPFSMHAELLYHWLTALGLPAPAAVDIRTVPPPLMASALAAGELDAFCVGEPWGSMAVETNAGALLLPGSAIWPGAPEKVLGVRADLADASPEPLRAMIRALWRAGEWLSDPQSRTTACAFLSRRDYVDVPAEMIDRALSGHLTLTSRGDSRIVPDFVGFAQNTPQQDHAAWIAGRLAARLGLDRATARQAAIATWRTDLHDTALRAIPGYSPRPDAMTHSFDGQEFSPSLQE
ncbi:ABC transporter substrate-binding protein [Sulfitobacter sp. PR48]|jgi:NitT/TauT family transport system ATP-binding protein|uniref:ABC transporter substrate-binding protein n=1 Tax=unclassified Sulfitobacter TaxID=196795 RepID=UPI0022B01480|nr:MULTISPECIES: ABC transporter substrate-binding protein [unclassified Sulfitobacter]MCZ4254010.1 ABC transporter substrate-binding protein [Sulfitobacter sp. G21635-S1]MDD9720787.1 ABC transporter substrate-binding protein [Sulfitobacter sp. PR48]